MKNILVTGGAGFIGSHLCEYLLNKGNNVYCVDNFFTGDKENIRQLLENKNFKFINHDIIHPLFIDDILIDQVYNLACPASPIHYQKNPIRTIKANTIGVINMLGLAKKHKATFFQASTSEVYGDPTIHPQDESYRGNVNTIGPRACFSDDTQILTISGWKKFIDLTKKTKIATLNPNNHHLEYHYPNEIIRYEYTGKMYFFNNLKLNLLVTPNHKMYVQKKHHKNFEFVGAQELINWDGAQAKTGSIWIGKEQEKFYLPKIINSRIKNVDSINMDLWLEFFGYYISEGCVHVRRREKIINGKTYVEFPHNILIAQSKEKNNKNYFQIKKCLKKLPFNFFDSDDHQFRIVNLQLGNYLKTFGKSHDKYIPQEIKQLSSRQLKILFDALMLGDGDKRKSTYYTSSQKLANDIQEIALKIGLTAKICLSPGRNVYALNLTYKHKNKSKKDFLTPKYPIPQEVFYSGFVNCVNVKNHLIYVRRSGKPVWCGNCYDEGKRVAETLCFDYHRQGAVDIRVVRIFNTYGPRMALNDGRVVSNFIIQALENKDITIYGEGNQTRSFCYVDDLVEGFYRMMEQKDTIGPINLGNPGEFTIKELALKVKEYTNSNSNLIYEPLPVDDPVKRKPDITLAKKYLNWEPKIKLEEGLLKTIAYFKDILKK